MLPGNRFAVSGTCLGRLCLRTERWRCTPKEWCASRIPATAWEWSSLQRTPEQRAQVGNLISFLRSGPESMPEMSVSPRALTADLSQFEAAPDAGDAENAEDTGRSIARTVATRDHACNRMISSMSFAGSDPARGRHLSQLCPLRVLPARSSQSFSMLLQSTHPFPESNLSQTNSGRCAGQRH